MTDFATNAAPARDGMKLKHIFVLLLFAFAGGAGVSWWLADEYGWFENGEKRITAPAPVNKMRSATAVQLTAPPTISSIDSAIAAGNTARAEGLLVAFAARRAIDSGTPLGYLTDQLRLRFGTSQPDAVITIMEAAQTPVTLQSLQSELSAIENLLLTGMRDETFWATIQREFSELFVLRKSESLSPAPTQRLLRAHALVESGNLSGAILEISSMPGGSSVEAQAWLARARTYAETRKALDILERSALAAPPIPVLPLPATAPSIMDVPTQSVMPE
jgi:Mitochondrial inner membrane protein